MFAITLQTLELEKVKLKNNGSRPPEKQPNYH